MKTSEDFLATRRSLNERGGLHSTKFQPKIIIAGV